VAENTLHTLVEKNFESFSKLEGSQHIASMSSQLNLAENLKISNAGSILDWGSGIGTLIPLYLSLTDARVVAFERNDWCLVQFKKNIGQVPRVELVDKPPVERSFDFIVIDDEIKLGELFRVIKHAGNQTTIFIEGWRNSTLAKTSFLLLLLLKSVKAERYSSRLSEFGHSGSFEKSGAALIVNASNPFSAITSWFNRQKETKELMEFERYLLRKLGIYRILGKLSLGDKLRSMIGAKPKLREKAWRVQAKESARHK
jgi:hypothetical protein